MSTPMRNTIALAVVLNLSACATTSDDHAGAQRGAVIGAIAGGLLGLAAGGDARSAAIGAAAGAAVGAIIGEYQDRQTASRAEAARRYAVNSQPRLEMESSVNAPSRAQPGSTVESQVGYTVLSGNPGDTMQVQESRTLVMGQDSYPLSKRQVLKPQGSHVSTLKFTLPKDLLPGRYTLVTTLTTAGLTRSARTPLQVG